MAKVDLETLTEQLTEKILSGELTKLRALWSSAGSAGIVPRNLTSRRRYQGVNALILMDAALSRGYASPLWTTASQCNTLGGHIKKGETCQYVVVWQPREKKTLKPDGSEEVSRYLFHRLHAVFNYEQTSLAEAPAPTCDHPAPDDALLFLEQQLPLLGIGYEVKGDSAYYSPSRDCVVMPHRTRFFNPQDYTAVLAHETVHATGHPSRLNRDTKGVDKETREDYAFEELVAELGATFLCAELGITGTYEAHESYLASWVKLFQDKKRALLTAASAASKAFEMIMTGELPSETQNSDSQSDRPGD